MLAQKSVLKSCSPAARLTTYEFISCLAGILPHFDFELDESTKLDKPEIAEAFTIAMEGKLNVKITPKEVPL